MRALQGEAPTAEENKRRVEQLEVQLAGCSVAALGGTGPEQLAKRGDFGWSPAYQDVVDLRVRYNAAISCLKRVLSTASSALIADELMMGMSKQEKEVDESQKATQEDVEESRR